MLEPERKERRRKRYLGFFICLGLCGALGAWHNWAVARGQNDIVTASVRTVLSPFVGSASGISRWFSRQFGWLTQGRSLATENERLREQVAALTEENARLHESEVEAGRLREQLGFTPPAPYRRLAASVLSFKPNANLETMVIGRGSRDNVTPNSVVVALNGAVIGHVIDVAPTSSVVLLLTDPVARIGAMVQRPASRAVGVCLGSGGGMLSLAYLDQSADIKEGDTIISSGMGREKGVFPKGLVIGKVAQVGESGNGGATRIVSVKPAVNLNRMEEVYVLSEQP